MSRHALRPARTSSRRGVAALAACLSTLSLLSGATQARDLTVEQRVAAQDAIERVYFRHQTGATSPFEEVVTPDALERMVRDSLGKSAALAQLWHTPVTAEMLRAERLRIEQHTLLPDRLEEIYEALGRDAFLVEETLVRAALVDRLARSAFASDERIHADSVRQANDLRSRWVSTSSRRDTEAVRRVFLKRSAAEASVPCDAPESDGVLLALSAPDFEAFRARIPAPPGEVGPIEQEEDRFVVRSLLSEAEGEAVVEERWVPRVGWDEWWEESRSGYLDDEVRAVSDASDSLSVIALTEESERRSSSSAVERWDPDAFGRVPNSGSYRTVWTGSLMLLWRRGLGGHDNSGRYDPLTDTWSSMSTFRAPSPGVHATAVWTGTEMIVWGGGGTFPEQNTGGRYDPTTNTWRATTTVGAPSPRSFHTAVWTGSRMIVWGGGSSPHTIKSGGSYDPYTDRWTPTSTTGAIGRSNHVAVWTGARMVVWGGTIDGSNFSNTGARYDPATDTWQNTTTVGAPSLRRTEAAVWTGTKVFVWGGQGPGGSLGTGGLYDPVGDAWSPVSNLDAPTPRSNHTIVWTGSSAVVWGGSPGPGALNTGGRYDPSSDSWSATSTLDAPTPRELHSAVWSGSRMIVWGGIGQDTGGRYDPASDSWTPTSDSGAPTARSDHTAIWTGNLMVVWGGLGSSNQFLQTGGRFDPVLDSWSPTSLTGAPSARYQHTTVWTGNEMVVWGGYDGSRTNTGGRYNPLTDQWVPTSLTGAPEGRTLHTATFSGSVMTVWGGSITLDGDSCQESFPNTGGRYDPATDTWQPTSTAGAPVGRHWVTSVWTGSRMLVWGGVRSFRPTPFDPCLSEYPGIGGQYDPASDAWFPMAPIGGTRGHKAVWTGSEMIVWGGPDAFAGTGSRYDPVTDQWGGVGAPDDFRSMHTLVWDGSRVTLWGGTGNSLGSGYGYDPLARRWSPVISATDAPAGRSGHTAVWTGESMLIWGGGLNTGGRYLPGETDSDGDGTANTSDVCPFDPDDDADGDSVCLFLDNCPSVANPQQADSDGDGFGDACDSCPGAYDPSRVESDADGVGDACDNCPAITNAAQVDADGDGSGNLCDLCPLAADPAQIDSDGDGAGDACDCQAGNATDRPPPAVDVQVARAGISGALLTWNAALGADGYSISRSPLSSLSSSDFGPCLANGVVGTNYLDDEVPSAGEGFAYLIQGQNYACGLGSLGYDSSETVRSNVDPGACAGQPVIDSHPTLETAVFGTVSGSYLDTTSSNDVREEITEVLSTGSPASRFSRLEHRWTIPVASGSLKELHVEGFRTATEADDFRFEYSTDGGATFTPISLASLPFSDDDLDRQAVLPAGLSGTILVRVVDTDRTPGNQWLDTVSIDEIFIRVVP